MMELFDKVCAECSKITTRNYSTSFWSATRLLDPEIKNHIHNIYGFVRFADEIVDSFHNYPQEMLLTEFQNETYKALLQGISLNPILNSFQITVRHYSIPPELIEAFFRSMEMDLTKKSYDAEGYREYIYGSAEVVGLMCLQVFCNADIEQVNALEPAARALGAAFQKVNFLRDVQSDYELLNRVYFPDVDFNNFTKEQKQAVEEDIEADFKVAAKGIAGLPDGSRRAVELAYSYYYKLFKKICSCPPQQLLTRRIRVPDYEKLWLFATARLANFTEILRLR